MLEDVLSRSEDRAKWLAKTPLRIIASSHDVALAVLYLASDESSWVTGQILAVDGGVDVGGRAIWQFE